MGRGSPSHTTGHAEPHPVVRPGWQSLTSHGVTSRSGRIGSNLLSLIPAQRLQCLLPDLV